MNFDSAKLACTESLYANFDHDMEEQALIEASPTLRIRLHIALKECDYREAGRTMEDICLAYAATRVTDAQVWEAIDECEDEERGEYLRRRA